MSPASGAKTTQARAAQRGPTDRGQFTVCQKAGARSRSRAFNRTRLVVFEACRVRPRGGRDSAHHQQARAWLRLPRGCAA